MNAHTASVSNYHPDPHPLCTHSLSLDPLRPPASHLVPGCWAEEAVIEGSIGEGRGEVTEGLGGRRERGLAGSGSLSL